MAVQDWVMWEGVKKDTKIRWVAQKNDDGYYKGLEDEQYYTKRDDAALTTIARLLQGSMEQECANLKGLGRCGAG